MKVFIVQQLFKVRGNAYIHGVFTDLELATTSATKAKLRAMDEYGKDLDTFTEIKLSAYITNHKSNTGFSKNYRVGRNADAWDWEFEQQWNNEKTNEI